MRPEPGPRALNAIARELLDEPAVTTSFARKTTGVWYALAA